MHQIPNPVVVNIAGEVPTTNEPRLNATINVRDIPGGRLRFQRTDLYYA
jgi:hypothetical protein